MLLDTEGRLVTLYTLMGFILVAVIVSLKEVVLEPVAKEAIKYVNFNKYVHSLMVLGMVLSTVITIPASFSITAVMQYGITSVLM